MKHALVLGRERLREKEIDGRLIGMGFSSLCYAKSESAALTEVEFQKPDIIILFTDHDLSWSADALMRISERADAPILVATRDAKAAAEKLGPAASLHGPYPVDDFDGAIAAARHEPPLLAEVA